MKLPAPRILAYTALVREAKSDIISPEVARKWVQENAKKGADGIKFFGARPEIMQAALEENKSLGLRSAMHHAQMDVARWNVVNSAKSRFDHYGTLVRIT